MCTWAIITGPGTSYSFSSLVRTWAQTAHASLVPGPPRILSSVNGQSVPSMSRSRTRAKRSMTVTSLRGGSQGTAARPGGALQPLLRRAEHEYKWEWSRPDRFLHSDPGCDNLPRPMPEVLYALTAFVAEHRGGAGRHMCRQDSQRR